MPDQDAPPSRPTKRPCLCRKRLQPRCVLRGEAWTWGLRTRPRMSPGRRASLPCALWPKFQGQPHDLFHQHPGGQALGHVWFVAKLQQRHGRGTQPSLKSTVFTYCAEVTVIGTRLCKYPKPGHEFGAPLGVFGGLRTTDTGTAPHSLCWGTSPSGATQQPQAWSQWTPPPQPLLSRLHPSH